MALDGLHTVDRQQVDRTRWGLISSVPFDLFFEMKLLGAWNLLCDLSPPCARLLPTHVVG